MKSLGFGIVGTGMIAAYHARAITEAHGARLVGCATRSTAKAREFAAAYGVEIAVGNVEELVARPEVDVVCITTPSGAHLEPALAAIRAGKHVLVEKPIEITLERVDELLAAADRVGVRVGAIFQSRFGAGVQAVKAAVVAGRFGRLVLASVAVKWHRSAEYYTGWKGTLNLDGGGAVINQAIHGLDLLQWLAGMPSEVFAWKARRVHTGIEAEDTACAALRFPGGACGTIEATTATWPGWARRIEICGEHGSVCLEDDVIAKWEFKTALPGDEEVRASAGNAALGSGAASPGAISHVGHLRQIQDFVDAIREDRPVVLDGSEARKAVALVRGLYESAERGVAVGI